MKYVYKLSVIIVFFLGACSSLSFKTNTPSSEVWLENNQEKLIQPTESGVSVPIKIGLALGGGAARGFAHIGVIKALESQGIVVDIVTGTSAGSVVGALFAAGYNGFELQKIALEMDQATMSDWVVPLFNDHAGVLKGAALQTFINKKVGQLPIERLNKPLGIVATHFATGAPILFQRGNTGLAVRASSAVPGVFQPVVINKQTYVDGGLVAPVPVSFARTMGADIVIAVNISADPTGQDVSTTLGTLLQTFAIMGNTINQYELQSADIVIKPKLAGMKGHDFNGRHAAILAGERAAMEVIAEIKRKIIEATKNKQMGKIGM